jgi:hypothetical protein
MVEQESPELTNPWFRPNNSNVMPMVRSRNAEEIADLRPVAAPFLVEG